MFLENTASKMSNNTSNSSSSDEFERNSERFKKYQLVPMSIIFGIGLLANSMVIFNGIRRRKVIKHFSNYFVLSMAIADWCVMFFTVPAMFVEYLVGFKSMSDYVCSYILTIRETFQGAAMFSISTLAILRVRQVITNPLRQFSKRTCRLLVVAIWLISFLICTSPFYSVYEIDEHGFCDPNYASTIRAKIHLTFITCILISPMLVATISYGTVIMKVTNFLGSDPDSERITKRNRSVAMLLIVLILSCWISYTPLGVYLLFDVYSASQVNVDPLIWQIVTILYFGGSAVNPILVLLTMPKDYKGFDIECRRQRRVGVEDPNAVQKEILKASIPLHAQIVTQEVPPI